MCQPLRFKGVSIIELVFEMIICFLSTRIILFFRKSGDGEAMEQERVEEARKSMTQELDRGRIV